MTRSGFNALGVNTVAAEAGVDKVLIYRYFGGFPELLAHLARGRRLWPTADDAVATERSLDRALFAALRTLAHELRERPLVREGVTWEMVEENPLTDELVAAREREIARLFDLLKARFSFPPYLDVPTFVALLTAAITYLAAHRTAPHPVLGLDLDSEATWQRIEKTLGAIIRTVVGGDG
jgi:AcrR family transcriptional regulator